MAQTLLEMEIEEEQMALRQKQATELAKMATADLKTKQALIGTYRIDLILSFTETFPAQFLFEI
jgi:hypothetical protein